MDDLSLNQDLSTGAPTGCAPPSRQRLPADVRIHQILDAALQAFASEGFAATRIDDIARQAGLSKGGIYTHFKSKDEIFEALLTRELTPKSLATRPPESCDPVTVDRLIEQIIDPMYEDLSDRQTIQTLRLLLTDGAHIPHRVAQWRHNVIDPHLAEMETLVRRGVADGTLRNSAAVQAPWLLIAPGVYAAMWKLVCEEDATPALLAEQRLAHIAMLRELLAQPLLHA
jgi:AcrR family transcriptional regulator